MFETMTLEELVRPEGYDCPCGKHHACGLDYLKIGRGAIAHVAEMVAALGKKEGSFRIAGKQPFAMYHPLSDTPAPDYFGIAFD